MLLSLLFLWFEQIILRFNKISEILIGMRLFIFKRFPQVYSWSLCSINCDFILLLTRNHTLNHLCEVILLTFLVIFIELDFILNLLNEISNISIIGLSERASNVNLSPATGGVRLALYIMPLDNVYPPPPATNSWRKIYSLSGHLSHIFNSNRRIFESSFASTDNPLSISGVLRCLILLRSEDLTVTDVKFYQISIWIGIDILNFNCFEVILREISFQEPQRLLCWMKKEWMLLGFHFILFI